MRWFNGALVVGLCVACGGADLGAERVAPEADSNPEAASIPERVVPPEPPADAGTSLLSFPAGAAVVRATSSYTRGALPAFAIDGSATSYWQFDYAETTEQELVIELVGPARIDRIGMLDPQELASRPSVRIELGDSAEGPWRLVGSLSPVAGQRVSLAVSPAQTASHVRFVLPERATAEAEAILVAEAFAYGELIAAPPTAQVAGIWHGGWHIGGVHLLQDGVTVTGCHASGAPVTGVVDGRTLYLQYPDPYGTKSRAEIVWVPGANKPFLTQTLGDPPGGQEFGELAAVEAVDCTPSASTAATQVDALKVEITETGKALVYDLLFDFNRSTLRPTSDATLDRIVTLLQAEPTWRLRIEGHTDDVGGSGYNQALSEARAANTVQALVQRGIEASRLESAGFGDTRPVASNQAAGGRAANRRVELVRL